jgi:predicted Ser/Thr protein kinase
MGSVRWLEISRLFQAAVDLPPPDRTAFLDRACGDDEFLRRDVESLLKQLSAEPDFLSVDRGTAETAVSGVVSETVPRSGFTPGEVFAERYRIVAFLGRGGMGEVYRADDLKLGQPIALKLLAPFLYADGRSRTRFLSEVRLARRVSHPNVCRVYDVGESNGALYLTMEFIDGENLRSLLRRIRRLPADKAIDIAQQLCAGLAAAHDAGVTHRDLKPANVMIDGRGVARITDFGLAVSISEGSPPEVAGTPAYMAPEQLAGRGATTATDLYALGLVLYEIFTGRPVFMASSVEERLATPRDFEPPPPSIFARDLEVSVEEIIWRCISDDAEARPRSALAVGAAFPAGDLVTAALAAGRTPSPDLVATSGAFAGLRPIAAWIALLAGIAGLGVAARYSGTMMLYGQARLEKAPPVLADRARTILASLGYRDRPADSAHWFSHFSYEAQVAERDGTVANVRPSSGPPAIVFVYRESPRQLVPSNMWAVVAYRDPPADIAGMTDVSLDPAGRLVRLIAVPPEFDGNQHSSTEPDWSSVFAAAGLDPPRFSAAEPSWLPPVPFDTRRAWTGVHPDWHDTPVRVMAAAVSGKPVYFDIRPVAEEMAPGTRIAGGQISDTVVLLLLAIAWIGAGVLARRNLRLGQGDRKGAMRLAAYFGTCLAANGLLRADHAPQFGDEYFVLMRIAGWTLVWTGSLFLFYIGFEPFARRRWPRMFASWTRVLAGRFRDPLVGRDALVGGLCGISVMLLRELEFTVAGSLFASPLAPYTPTLEGLRAPRHVAASLLFVQSDSLMTALVGLFVFVLFRTILRRHWLAVCAWVLITAPVMITSRENLPLEISIALASVSFAMLILLRFGLLAFGVMIFFYRALTTLPITLDFSAWYIDRSLVILSVLGGVLLYAFRVAVRRASLVAGAA